MSRRGGCIYSLTKLQRLWADGKTNVEIASALGCSVRHVEHLRDRHNLPARPRAYHGPQEDDPTPQQIAERAAECRARRPEPATPKDERISLPRYSWNGVAFHALG
jgi:hypothetical protein